MKSQADYLDLILEWESQQILGNSIDLLVLAGGDEAIATRLALDVAKLRNVAWIEEVAEEGSASRLSIPSRDVLRTALVLPEVIELKQLVANLRKSAVIADDDIDRLLDSGTVRSSFQLISKLLEQNLATRFQIRAIVHGKTRGLKLGRYVILDKIGEGGMGQVFKARHSRMNRVVALKILPREAMRKRASVDRFFREVQAAAKLNHTNIVTAFDSDESDGYHFLVMEFVPGQDLYSLVRQQGPLDASKAVNYITQAARGLEYAHNEGLVHRDIKPANLLVSEEGVVKILDMGIARLITEGADRSDLTQEGAVMGTVDYMPPEQAVNSKRVDHRADLYSLGCSLYYLLSGRPPFDGDALMVKLLAHREQRPPDLTGLRPDVPSELNDIFQRCMAKSPDQRYANASSLIADLENVASIVAAKEAEVGTSPPEIVPLDTVGNSFVETAPIQGLGSLFGTDSSSKTTKPPFASRRRLLVGLAGALGLLMVVLGLAWNFSSQESSTNPTVGELVIEIVWNDHQPNVQEDVLRVVQTESQVLTTIMLSGPEIVHPLEPGEYRLLRGNDADLKATPDTFTVTSGEQTRLSVSWARQPPSHAPEVAPEEQVAKAELPKTEPPTPADPQAPSTGNRIPSESISRDTYPGVVLPPSELLVSKDYVWSEPINLGPMVNSPGTEWNPCVSPNGLELIFASARYGGVGKLDLWVSRRSSRSEPWGNPVSLREINTAEEELTACFSPDGLTLFFTSTRPGGMGNRDIWMTTRSELAASWDSPVNLGPVINDERFQSGGAITPDGLELYYQSWNEESRSDDLWVARRPSVDQPFNVTELLGQEINSDRREINPWLTSDGLTLLFQRQAPGSEIWMSQRESLDSPWKEAQLLPDNMRHRRAVSPSLTADATELYFEAEAPGMFAPDLYMSRRIPKNELDISPGPMVITKRIACQLPISEFKLLEDRGSAIAVTNRPVRFNQVNLKSGETKRILADYQTTEIIDFAHIPGTTKLVAMDKNGMLSLRDWSLPDSLVHTFRKEGDTICTSIHLSPDGKTLLALPEYQSECLSWDIPSLTPLANQALPSRRLSFMGNSLDGKSCYCVSDAGLLVVIDFSTGTETNRVLLPSGNTACVLPDGRLLATNNHDEVYVFDMASRQETKLGFTHSGIVSLDLSPLGDLLLLRGGNSLKVLEWPSLDMLNRSTEILAAKSLNAGFSSDGKAIVSSHENYFDFWDWNVEDFANEPIRVISDRPADLNDWQEIRWKYYDLEKADSRESWAVKSHLRLAKLEFPENRQTFQVNTFELTGIPSRNVAVALEIQIEKGQSISLVAEDPNLKEKLSARRSAENPPRTTFTRSSNLRGTILKSESEPNGVSEFREVSLVILEKECLVYWDGQIQVRLPLKLGDVKWSLVVMRDTPNSEMIASIRNLRYAEVPNEISSTFQSTIPQDTPIIDVP